jgi:alpha-L-fucosidase
VIQEDISAGERIMEFVLEGRSSGWSHLSGGCVVGHKRILRFEEIEVSKVRLTVRRARGRPQIRRLAVFPPA